MRRTWSRRSGGCGGPGAADDDRRGDAIGGRAPPGGAAAEAENLYRQVLAVSPDHAEALHKLGVLACQVGRLDAAIELIGRAITVDPNSVEYHSDLGESAGETGSMPGRRPASAGPGTEARVCRGPMSTSATSSGIPAAPRRRSPRIAGRSSCGPTWPRPTTTWATPCGRGPARRGDHRVHAGRSRWARPGRSPQQPGQRLWNDLGRLDEAIAAYHRAAWPFGPTCRSARNLANALRVKGRLDEAIATFGRASR